LLPPLVAAIHRRRAARGPDRAAAGSGAQVAHGARR
jgi:hypothetical protein